MDALAIVGLAALILAKEAGVPLPIPGDLVIIGTGAALTGDGPTAALVLSVILVAGFIGASAQFFLLRTAVRGPFLRALERLGVGEERLRGLSERFVRGGSGAIAVARMTPGVRIGVIPAAAIAALPFRVFLPGVVAGNAVFVAAHFGLGFIVGAYAKTIIAAATGPVLAIVVLVVLAAAGWFVLRRRRAAARQGDAYECWADCSCPACVAIVARDTLARMPTPDA
jgi:membrane protein DedA with SNARE-associated domain